MRHILKEVNQVSLFSPFFLYSFSNNHLEETIFFFFCERSELLLLLNFILFLASNLSKFLKDT